ncbi:MAG TPA: family 14 glycosylhydrolase [Chitinivibrionales bacterium]
MISINKKYPFEKVSTMHKHEDRLMAVMAPLKLRDDEFLEFSNCLKEAKGIGVEAVTVDVWWGLVMQKRDDARWDYYDRVFAEIEKAGLRIVPIMSFHRCGGGPGDDVNVPLPGWLSEVVAEANKTPGDLLYQSETGYESLNAIAPWVAEEAPGLYDAMSGFIDGFLKKYKQELLRSLFPEINVSLGPTGELRYPAYSAEEGWVYPHRGYYQCYSESARRSFLQWVRNPRHACSWAAAFPDSEIRVPNGHLPPGSGARADSFVAQRLHCKPGYGQDFLAWYHQSLLNHGQRILKDAIKVVKTHCKDLSKDVAAPTLGVKIPGVHWQWRCTGVPRYAELTAGLIAARYCYVPDDGSDTGYEDIFKMVKSVAAEAGWPVRVHFTALEMDDDAVDCSWPNDQEKTSMAFSLVNAVGRTAARFSVLLSGENALPDIASDDSPYDIRTWDYIRKAFDTGHFSGLTMLRLCRGNWDIDKESLRQFIRDYDTTTPGKRLVRKR